MFLLLGRAEIIFFGLLVDLLGQLRSGGYQFAEVDFVDRGGGEPVKPEELQVRNGFESNSRVAEVVLVEDHDLFLLS